MLIRCPTCSCGTELALDASGGPGRVPRCSRCHEGWTLPDDAAAPEIVAEARSGRRASASPIRLAPVRKAAPRQALRRMVAGASGVALVLGSVSAGMAAIAFKEGVVRLLPRSAGLFAAIGLPVNLRGLSIADVHGTLAPDASRTGDVLTLEGRISNMRRAANTVPYLRVAIRDKSRTELYSWLVPPPKPRLARGETVVFHARLASPPPDGQDIVVRFAASKDAGTAETR